MTVAESHPFDALMPADMARKAEQIGVAKARMAVSTSFVLAVLAGAFIGMGAMFATTVAAGSAGLLPYGLTRLLTGLVFSLGLILVVVGGAELFTGNNLIVMAWVSGKIGLGQILRNWAIVYVGNFVGALGTVGLVFLSGQYTFGGGAVGAAALATAESKSALGPLQAFVLGILCNALVCMAVWLSYSARTTTDRMLAVTPPVAAFVAAGFEHSIANMYFVPMGLLVRWFAPSSFWSSTRLDPTQLTHLSVDGFLLNNLLPVTLGNIVGGGLLVGAIYWLAYLRPQQKTGTGAD